MTKSNKIVTQGVYQVRAPIAEHRIHPTQKAPEVIEELLRVLPDDASSVLDPFCGSGTTGVAAMRRGLDFVGIEISADYCEAARGRLAATQKILDETSEAVDQHRKQELLWK